MFFAGPPSSRPPSARPPLLDATRSALGLLFCSSSHPFKIIFSFSVFAARRSGRSARVRCLSSRPRSRTFMFHAPRWPSTRSNRRRGLCIWSSRECPRPSARCATSGCLRPLSSHSNSRQIRRFCLRKPAERSPATASTPLSRTFWPHAQRSCTCSALRIPVLRSSCDAEPVLPSKSSLPSG
eukprot:Amastigsp_a508460_803.p3 type:complete len:182 gc:universal Amastigsp_a508460_803:894-349(-)